MPERDRAAVDVELLFGDVELAPDAFDAAERLVHLEQVDVVELPAGLLEATLDRALRRREEQLGLVRELALPDDPRGRLAAGLAPALLPRARPLRPAIVDPQGVVDASTSGRGCE